MTNSPDLANFAGRLRRVVSVHRWSVVAGTAVFLFAAATGAAMGLHPVIMLVLVAVVVGGSIGGLRWRERRGDTELRSFRPVVSQFAMVGVVTLVLIQAVPYGRSHSNPPVLNEPAWATPETRELMVRACFGCHSNEVEWPWYAKIAPVSWAIQSHVDEGRDEVNYSEFRRGGEFDETVEVILEGEMPPGYYTAFGLHPEANLTDAERAELISGLRATPGLDEGDEHEDEEDEDEDEDEDDD